MKNVDLPVKVGSFEKVCIATVGSLSDAFKFLKYGV